MALIQEPQKRQHKYDGGILNNAWKDIFCASTAALDSEKCINIILFSFWSDHPTAIQMSFSNHASHFGLTLQVSYLT